MAVIQRFRSYRPFRRPAHFDLARETQLQIAFILARYDHGAIPLAVHKVVEDLRIRAELHSNAVEGDGVRI
ncbi:MAG: hypothetical protein O9972_61590 [Burkholderiales bacterium]|nr:hypothetical protein [Burkholderiales bacterium]